MVHTGKSLNAIAHETPSLMAGNHVLSILVGQCLAHCLQWGKHSKIVHWLNGWGMLIAKDINYNLGDFYAKNGKNKSFLQHCLLLL